MLQRAWVSVVLISCGDSVGAAVIGATAILRELIAAGLHGEALVAAFERIESAEIRGQPADKTAIDEQAERRREQDRLRKSAERLRKSAEVCGLARVEDITTTTSQVDRKNSPPPPSSAEIRGQLRDFFETSFWPSYPRKVGKGAARRAFETACGKTSPETIIAAVKAFAAQCVGKDENYIPHAATWLNAERWQDANLQNRQFVYGTGATLHTSNDVYVKYGTNAGDAWVADFKTKGKVAPRDSNGGWWFPSEFPSEGATQ